MPRRRGGRWPARRHRSARSARGACPGRGSGRPRRRRARSPRRAPRSRATSSSGMPPARRIAGGATVQSTIVDSTPTVARAAVEDVVDVVAEVGAHVFGRRRADPTEAVGRRGGEPAVERSEQLERQRVGRHAQADGVQPAGHHRRDVGGRVRARTVSGPGQQASASVAAAAGTDDAHRASPSAAAMCTINGWSAGRPLTWKIRRTARSFVASAAKPVHGLGGDRDQPAGPHDIERLAHPRVERRGHALTPARPRGSRARRR